jgi:hypothetical protein
VQLAAAVAGTLIVVLVLLWYLMRALEAGAAKRDPDLSPLADTRQTPPAPRLQDAPLHDYATYRASQDAYLNSYGWVDRQQSVAHIPIEQAMNLLIERGWPKTTGTGRPEPSADSGTANGAQQQDAQQKQQPR